MVKTQLIIIQPTPLCNMNCHYCYLPYRTLKKCIEISTLAQIGKSFFTSPFAAESVTIVWHAGEPLVLPISFYEQAFQCIQEQNVQGVQIRHSFQTNATLITQAWCDFFKTHHAQVGVSLDGPQHIHDVNRVDWRERGTFERVMKGVHLLQQNQIPFSVIAVVTEHALRHAEELWRFFMDMRPESLCLNPEEIEGAHTATSLQAEEKTLQYKAFLQEMLMLNAHSDRPLHIREFDMIHESVEAGKYITRSQTNVPGAIFNFDCDGNVSTFSPEMLAMSHPEYGKMLFGNVFTDTLENMLLTQKFLAVQGQIERGVQSCLQTCEYFMFCGGGFPSNKLSEHGTFDATETQTCRLRVKMIADTMLEHWEEQYHLI